MLPDMAAPAVIDRFKPDYLLLMPVERLAFCPGKGRFGALFLDVTQAKEDEENLRRTLSIVLRQEGYDVEAAASGALVAGDPELLRAALPAGRSLRAADPSVAGASAVAVAQLGLELLRAGRTADPETLEPAYALDFVALTKRPS